MTQGDLVCFSHLRWGFVFQRPNHLMVRFARRQRVFFVEEPRVLEDGVAPYMEVTPHVDGVFVCVPWLPPGLDRAEAEAQQHQLLSSMVAEHRVQPSVLWFYTPMALGFAGELSAPLVVYDCMDELSAFRGAPPELVEREQLLFARADLVFTGGHSLYRAKRHRHPAVFPFPSSVDAVHFATARTTWFEPEEQCRLPRPRIGYFGVIDERLDLPLVAAVAEARPDWQIVMIGPVVKIDPRSLPERSNLHWLGGRAYEELPAYLAGWDVALMPFALNASTEFISPTKTLEYMAAGCPVVSTAIADVVDPYGHEGVVRVADRNDFVRAIGDALLHGPPAGRLAADAVVSRTSWDATFTAMTTRMSELLALRHGTRAGRKAVDSCSTI
jgi:glycosyltransferase involved in cell wall biosynthesis